MNKIIFNLKKKSLKRKLEKTKIKTKKEENNLRKLATQEKELMDIKTDINNAKKLCLGKEEIMIIALSNQIRREAQKQRTKRIQKAKTTAKYMGGQVLTFLKNTGEYLEKLK